VPFAIVSAADSPFVALASKVNVFDPVIGVVPRASENHVSLVKTTLGTTPVIFQIFTSVTVFSYDADDAVTYA
jgi:hypothetical protein